MPNLPAQIDPNKELERLSSFQDLVESGIQSTPQLIGQHSLVEKSSLEDIPFIVTDFEVNQSDPDGPSYLNVKVVTQVNERLCFNDGGSGIRPVLEQWRADYPDSRGLMCARGLRVSRYQYQGRDAETYYLT